MPDTDDLTAKQAAFVREYTVDWNATQAAIRAGYSEKTASQLGYQLLQHPSVEAALSRRVEELAMSADEALIRMGELARGSLSPFHRLTADGDVVVDLSTKEAQDHLHLLTEMEVRTTKEEGEGGGVRMHQTAKLKMHDAKDALKQILRVHGLDKSTADVNLRTPDGIQVEELSESEVQERKAHLANRLAALTASTNGTNGQRDGDG